MTTRFTLPLLALGLTVSLSAPVAAQDFQLPPNPSPTPTPRVQGPVDDSGVVPVAPRPIPTATRTPAPSPAPAPAPSASPTPRPRATTTPPAAAGVATPASRPQRAQPATGSAAAVPSEQPLPQPAQSDAPAPTASAPGFDFPAPPVPAPSAPVPSAAAASDAKTGLPWWWWIAALAALALLGLAGWSLSRRKRSAKVPQEIERPIVGGAIAGPIDDPLRYLKIEVDAVRLSRSVMAATLSYRVTLSNRATEAMRHIVLDGDLTSAHGNAPVSEQLAEGATALPPLHTLDHLGAGQRKTFTGEMRLPLKDVRPIRQGNVPIYIPLVRLKARTNGSEPKAFTFVVGKTSNVAGARLQPFRLDTPPQTFSEIGTRPLG